MKILFVEKKLRTDKLGILYLSRIMKDAGHDVMLIQADVDDLNATVSGWNPDFIMYSVMSGDHTWFLKTNKKLKADFVFTSVVGGPHFTFFPEQGLADPDIDFVVQGPGEKVILDIVGGVQKERLVFGHMPDVNDLPPPDRSILYKYDEFGKARMKRFIAGRYCLYSCKYCFNHLFKRLYQAEKNMFFQRVSPEKIIEEIEGVRDQYGLELVYFNDDDLASDRCWITDFCDKYKTRVGIDFCGSIRASSVDYDLLATMREAGCVFLNIALESANPDTQKLLRRGFITNDQIKLACSVCEELGIKVRLQNMIGLPVDNPLEDALETLKMNQEISPTDSWASIFQPFPKTDLWQLCLDKGLIDEDTQPGTFYEHTPLKIEHSKEINALHKIWFFAVRDKWPMSQVRETISAGFTEEQEALLQETRWEIAKNLLYGM